MNANSRLQVQYSIPRHILAQVNHGPGTGPRMERQSVRLTPPLTTEAQARTAASIAPSSPGLPSDTGPATSVHTRESGLNQISVNVG